MTDRAWLIIRGVAPSLWAARLLTKLQTVGRSSECDICIAHKTVSRRHAEVWREGNELLIRDLGSSNGTFVNGERVTKSAFTCGNTIQIGAVGLAVVPSIDEAGGEDETELLSKAANAARGPLKGLSPGQLQVVNLFLQGLNEKQVADRLFLSRHTVHTHVKRIYKLLGVQSRAQLLAKYLKPEEPGPD